MSEWIQEIPSVRQQYNLLSRIWGRDVEPGFVFLPWIPREHATNKQKRALNFHNGQAFAWPPSDKGELIRAHLQRHKEDELYFTPARFYLPERRADAVASEKALWADLDEIDPRSIKFQPSIAWESSPGRFQAVWLFDTVYNGASNPGDINHRLTYLIEADRSGWDSTQLLRVPGSKNHKRSFEGEQGYVIFDEPTPRPTWEDFRSLPPVPAHEIPIEDEIFAETLEHIDTTKVLRRVKRKIRRYAWELIHATDTGGNDRSSVLWQIERELADADCTVEEIVAIVRETVWNKFADRADELKQLQREVLKTIAERVNKNLETLEFVSKDWGEWHDFYAWRAQPTPKIEWLVRDFWMKGGLGFIAGIPKSYKSWFGLNLALAVSSGREFLGVPAKQTRVLYIQEEDSLPLVNERMDIVIDSLYPDLHHFGWMEMTDSGVVWNPPSDAPSLQVRIQSGFIASEPDWMDKLEEFVTEHHIGLVIIDTLLTVLGDTDLDKAQSIRTDILNPLKEMARRLDLAVCFVHHNTKGKEAVNGKVEVSRASTRMLGSGQLHAWADCGIYVKDKTDNSIIIEIENKGRADRAMKILLDQPNVERWSWMPREVPEFNPTEERKETVPDIQKRGRQTPIIVRDLRKLGAIDERRAKAIPDLVEILGKTQSNLRAQVRRALENGQIAQTADERYYLP